VGRLVSLNGETIIAHWIVPIGERMGRAQVPIESTAEGIWTEVSDRLRNAVSDTTFRTFFSTARPRELTEDTFRRLGPERVHTGLDREPLPRPDQRHRPRHHRPGAPGPPHRRDSGGADAGRGRPRGAGRGGRLGRGFEVYLRFFVIGSQNRFAGAAALAVAEAPARAYNPLFIYGDTGLGKTHLLHAIANYVGDHSRELSVRYVTSETFVNDFINSLRDKQLDGFKQRYRTYDVLLIDDIQFFEHKERTQEEFFHTFNSLHGSGSQIVSRLTVPARALHPGGTTPLPLRVGAC